MYDRWLWNLMFGALPPWPCPTCQRGSLRLQRETLAELEPGESERARHNEESGYPDYYKRFSALLQCDNTGCKEVAWIAGDKAYDMADYGDGSHDWVEEYLPRAVSPAPLPFRLDPRVPKDIAELVRITASAIWGDLDQAANKLRHIIELLLTHERVGRKRRTEKGKLRSLTLHDRIELYGERFEDRANLLLAIKWLGNEGSHPKGDLTRADLLDAFAILERILDDVFVGTEATIRERARAINRAKGAPKARNRRPKSFAGARRIKPRAIGS
jgi:hypothetical protein